MLKKDSNSDGWKLYPQEPEKKRLTMLNRFVDRIRTTFQKFQNKPQKDHQLHGRIQDLQTQANLVLNHLTTIKDELGRELSSDIFLHVEEIVDPIIKEVSRLHKSIEKPGSVVHQAKTYQRYSQWIEKAKLWIQICSKVKDKEALVKAVIRYTVDDFLEVINRDIQVINDYQEHMLDALAIGDEEKIMLAQRLEIRLEPYLKGLNDLRARPKDLPLTEIAIWKDQVDKRREKYFDGALHAIDKVINDIIPDKSGPEEQEHLVDVLSQIAFLEREVPNLYDEIFLIKNPNEEQFNSLGSRLTINEQEIHQLNLDLRLPPDLIDKLQVLSEMLEQARKRLDEA